MRECCRCDVKLDESELQVCVYVFLILSLTTFSLFQEEFETLVKLEDGAEAVYLETSAGTVCP